MSKDLKILVKASAQKTLDSITLVEASLKRVGRFDVNADYSPREREPYDALCDRFTRAVETAIKFFRTYEKQMYAEYSETIRDLLHRMEKLEMISSLEIWMKMRDIRNRIVHDYLPEEIQDIYDSVMGEMGKNLLALKEKIRAMDFDKDK